MTGIRYEKIAVSLPAHAAESARRAVRRGRAASVSAYIAAAIEEKSKKESLDELLETWLQESGGPPTAVERRWVERVLGPKPRRRSAARRAR